jgi:quercetin dioxygenase-like cupin family protein
MSGTLIHDLAASYALGLLDGEELAAFERHLAAGCPACSDRIAEYRETIGTWSASSAAAPRPGLRDRLMARLRENRPLDRWIEDAGSGAVRRRIGRGELLRLPAGAEYSLVYEEWFVVAGSVAVGPDSAGAGDYGAGRPVPVPVISAGGDEPALLYLVPRNPATLGPSATIARAKEATWLPFAPGVELRILRRDHDASMLVHVRMAAGGVLPEHDHQTDEESVLLSGCCRVGSATFAAGDALRMPAGSHHDPVETDTGCEMIVLVEQLAA